MSKDVPEPRQAVFDELGVARRLTKGGELDTGLYTSLSHIDVVDLLCEGGIQGIVSGEYIFQGNLGDLGYTSYSFTPYKAVGAGGNCTEELGFLRSVYWNETPVVDKQGFYNFQEVNLEWTDGKPQGQVPALNSNLAFEKNLKGGAPLELSVFRSIGERLFGPSLLLASKKSGDKIESTEPGYYLGKQSPQPPILSGNIDRNAKTYIINNKECVGVRINIKVPRLMEQIQDDWNDEVGGTGDSWKGNEDKRGFFAQPEDTAKDGRQDPFGAGDMRARKIHYQIYSRPVYDTKHIRATSEDVSALAKKRLLETLSPDWKHQPDIDDEIFGRLEQPYVRSVDIDFLDNENNPHKSGVNPRESEQYRYFNGWEIRIIRLTPDSVHTHLQNESYIDSIVEMYDSKIRYPYCAMAYSKFSAEFFSRIPSRAYDTELLKVKVPNNYDPIMRTYSTEIWDGCFKAHKEWSNNPAWCFYDLITNNRYGLGEYIDKQFVDKWTLYEIAQYCDVLVSDEKGGIEPRFTLNHIITSREEAYKIINDMASAFRSIVYYAFGNIYVSQDRPRDPIYHFNTSNVTEGMFNYSSSAKKARHTVAIVRYADKNNMYKPAISYAEDQVGIQRYGIREIETTSIGCTSEAQAKRFGDWILKSEILETESVAFTAGQEGMYMRPGDVISIYDEFRNDRNLAGRTLKVEEGASGIIHSGVHCHQFFPREDESGDYRVTGNSIIIDKPLHFTADKLYKLNLLTPTSYFEPTQITPSDCVESGITTTTPAESEIEQKYDSAIDLGFSDTQLGTAYLSWEAFTTQNPQVGNSWQEYTPFQTVRNYTVDGGKGKFTMYIDPPERMPVRFRLYYTKKLANGTNVDVELHDTKYIQSDKNPNHKITASDNLSKAIALDTAGTLHGEGFRTDGDLKKCLEWYVNHTTSGPASWDATKELAKTELAATCWVKDGEKCGDYPRIKVVRPDEVWIIETSFVKPEGVTTLKLELTSPINAASTRHQNPDGSSTSLYPTFGFNLYKTHYYIKSIDEKITESITVTASNTDKALTSADIPEIRRNQIQTIYFSGFQAVPYTGNYSSEYSISGSGIVTQIWFDAAITTPLLDFDNYVITGYWKNPVDFSTGYENPDGANLIWAIEPAHSDITYSQSYTMDEEFASGHSELYRVINIQENEKKYDISALEYTPTKYAPAVGGPPPLLPPGDGCLPPINPRIDDGNGVLPTVFCCDGSIKTLRPCSETADLTHPDCEGIDPDKDPVGACCVVCADDPVSYECFGDDLTEEECMAKAVLKNSYELR